MEVKKERLAIVQERLMINGRRISENMIGSIQEVLVARIATKNQAQVAGRTENNRVVNFLGTEALIGKMVSVKITESRTNTLRGELLSLP